MATTLQPSTNSELQLYRVLRRANLLQYFDTFITQGGDDVQQLCEAGEDEFLEIMALVGMASKPLHVRRLQKALQEWLANPTAFDVPKKFPTIVMSMVGNGGGVSNAGRPGSTPSPLSSTEASLSPAHSVPSSVVDTQQQNLLVRGANSTSTSSSTLANIGSTNQTESVKLTANQQLQHMSAQVLNSSLNISARLSTSSPSGSLMTSLNSEQSPPWALQTRGPTPPGGSASLTSGVRRGRQGHVDIASSDQPMTSSDQPSPPDSPQEFKDVIKDGVYNPNDAAYIPTVSHPTLMDHQISAIAAAAAILARDLPPIEPKSLPKKQNSKDITTVMMMTSDDPNRLDAMRKYAAIYGRFDSKRKNHRPMSLHEISVNEAAAQLCHHFPALLTRREELFPLARQVVRDSGYQYSKGHSRAAEVLVQPKLEPLDHQQMTASALALSQSSQLTTFVSGVTSSEEDAYIEFQNELAHITLSLSEMDKEQARIRAALRVLLEANDLDQVRGLTAEMDVLNDRQEALAKRRHRVVSAMARYKKGGLRASEISDRSNLSSKQHTSKQGTKKNFGIITSSKSNTNANKLASNSHNIYGTNLSMSNNGAGSGIYNSSNNNTIGEAEVTTSTNPLNTLYLAAMQNQRDSLFEEGLRIATQYGMSDLAKEIMGMKTQTKAIQSEDSATVSLASSYPPANTTHSQTCSSTDIKTTPSSSSLITSFSSSSSVATSAAVTVSSDNISASSTEYLALGSGCWTHSPPTVNTSTVSSSSSPASLLFPSSVSVITSKPGKSITRPLANPTLPPSSSKSPKLTSPSSTAPTSTPSSTTVSTTSPTTQTSQSQTGKVNINTATSTTASSHYQQSSTTTPTTATKSGQTVEIEPRRSSRRRNGEPDYYLINGGEKRFRANSSGSTSASSPSGRRGSSNDRRKCAAAPPDTHPSISSPSKPYTLEPCNNNNNNSKNNNTIKGNGKNSKGNNSVDSTTMRLDMNEIRFRNPAAEIHKVRMGFQQRFEPLDRDKR